MKVHVSSWAWVDRSDLTDDQLTALKRQLTIRPKKVGDHPGDPPGPISLWTQEDDRIGMPRQYFLEKQSAHHQVTTDFIDGNKAGWPGDLKFSGTLNADQEKGVDSVVQAFTRDQKSGGLLQAVPGWGKTVAACAILARLNVPTLVTVHKTFLLRQWKRRIERFLPGAQVGIARQKRCDFKGKHIVLAMNTSLHLRDYGEDFYNYFGLVVSDEVHRIGAPTWSTIPPKFRARWRLGLSATPRRSDGAQNIFLWHIGPIIFRGSIERLPCKIKRVFNNISLPASLRSNPTLVKTTLATRLVCANKPRNDQIVSNIIRAAQVGRKIMVMSTIRGRHLLPLEAAFKNAWPDTSGPCPTTSFYLGGMSEQALEDAQLAQVIFATAQMAKEGLDIPELDTLILAAPMGNIEQAVGRIQREFPNKKEPMVVDFRDDNIMICRKLGEYRQRFYEQKGWMAATPAQASGEV